MQDGTNAKRRIRESFAQSEPSPSLGRQFNHPLDIDTRTHTPERACPERILNAEFSARTGKHEWVKLIVERVHVDGKSVVAMTLRSDYHLVLGYKENRPTEFSADPSVFTSVSNRHGSRPN